MSRPRGAQAEAEMIIMGEVQIKCRDRLAEMDNLRVRDKELLKHTLDDKSSQLDSARHRLHRLVITEQKRLLKAVKDEYEEKFKECLENMELQQTSKTVFSDEQDNEAKKHKWTRISTDKLAKMFRTNAKEYREVVNNATEADKTVV
uniref:Uncharacterized protein n=1 Tax=Glossina austeni TaxID=7395 RepID=A0A1A9US72_GLOAU